MKQIKVGDRVVYAHPEGGFNALVVIGPQSDSMRISLVFVHPGSGEVERLDDIPHVTFAKEEIDAPKLTGPKGKKKLETVKQMGLKADGYWRP